MRNKLKARVHKNRYKYNVLVTYQGKQMPVGKTISDGDISTYKLLEWNTREEAIEYILSNSDRLELVN